MTIRQFANLCGCNPQTLRYYDQVDLLKPVRVDPYSGYRFYDEEQATDFVKIRNLQSADFTIAEIKELLKQDHEAIWEAFEQKIAQQKEKLKSLRLLQKSYRTEMTQMQQKIVEVKEEIRRMVRSYDAVEEFGIGEEEYERVISCVEHALDEIGEADAPDEWLAEKQKRLEGTYDPWYEKHGWQQMREFFDEFSSLKDGSYELRMELNKAKENPYALVNCLLNLLMLRNAGKTLELHCDVKDSKDGQNHFWMLKRNG